MSFFHKLFVGVIVLTFIIAFPVQAKTMASNERYLMQKSVYIYFYRSKGQYLTDLYAGLPKLSI